MSKPKIRVLVCEVGKQPEVREIENDLSAMQQIVGGYIEAVGLEPQVHLICNEEGKLTGLPLNRPILGLLGGSDIVCGNFFITRHDEEGENISLTDADIARYRAMYEPVRETHASTTN